MNTQIIEGLSKELNVGDTVLVNNGLLIFNVKEIEGNDIICEVEAGGEISDRKSMSFPGKVLKQVYLSEQDKKDILFGLSNNIDYIACSFVSIRQDLIDIKNFLKANGGEDVSLIAKIENRSGIENIEEIDFSQYYTLTVDDGLGELLIYVSTELYAHYQDALEKGKVCVFKGFTNTLTRKIRGEHIVDVNIYAYDIEIV